MSLIPHPWKPDRPQQHWQQLWRTREPAGEPLLVLIDRGDPPPRPPKVLQRLLSPEEVARMGRFHQAADRERYLLGRGTLRLLLGAFLEREPSRIKLGTTAKGKPVLVGNGSIQFNLSHSGELVLLGFHRNREVGVDVEQLRPELEWEPIARRCLPPEQVATIRNTPPARQGAIFLDGWCRLEAVLKARGIGLFGLDGPDAEPGSGLSLIHI